MWIYDSFLEAAAAVSGDKFGSALSAVGNFTAVAAAGTNNDAGAVYIFERVGDTWEEDDTLTASDGAAGDAFGSAVVIFGNYTVVGAPLDDHNSQSDAGSVYVYKRMDDNSWEETQILRSPQPDAEDMFGQSLGFDGTYIVVGAPGDDTDGTGAGAIYTYKYNETTEDFDFDSQVLHENPSNNNKFGFAVSTRNNTIAVGSPLEAAGGGNAGTILIYTKNVSDETNDNWVFQEQLIPENSAGGDNFGSQVYLDFSRVVAGAPLRGTGGGNSGGAWSFGFNATTEEWVEEQLFAPDDLGGNDNFGTEMVTQANFLAFGVALHNSEAGAAYPYFYNDTSEEWEELEKLVPPGTADNDRVGSSVGLHCESLFVGAEGVSSDTGRVYLYKQNKTFAESLVCVPEIEYPEPCKWWRLFCRLKRRFHGEPDPIIIKECPEIFNPCVSGE